MKHMISQKARCPYYKHEDLQVIYCDGVTAKSVLHLAFGSATDSKDYKRKYCRDHFKQCRIFQMLEGRDEISQQEN